MTKLWDEEGIQEFEQIYMTLSENSKKLFGEELTKHQIKGRYQRLLKKHKDYRREKYK